MLRQRSSGATQGDLANKGYRREAHEAEYSVVARVVAGSAIVARAVVLKSDVARIVLL